MSFYFTFFQLIQCFDFDFHKKISVVIALVCEFFMLTYLFSFFIESLFTNIIYHCWTLKFIKFFFRFSNLFFKKKIEKKITIIFSDAFRSEFLFVLSIWESHRKDEKFLRKNAKCFSICATKSAINYDLFTKN